MGTPLPDDVLEKCESLARKILRWRLPARTVEDAVQDVLLALWQAALQHKIRSPLAYVATLSFRRASQVRSEYGERDELERSLEFAEFALDPSVCHAEQPRERTSFRVVGSIDSRTRDLVDLLNQGRSLPFIAEALSLDRKQLLRALRKLERNVESQLVLREISDQDLRGGDRRMIGNKSTKRRRRTPCHQSLARLARMRGV
jgi:DNA-directed RNA polymerase specialized sigma24 family protein